MSEKNNIMMKAVRIRSDFTCRRRFVFSFYVASVSTMLVILYICQFPVLENCNIRIYPPFAMNQGLQNISVDFGAEMQTYLENGQNHRSEDLKKIACPLPNLKPFDKLIMKYVVTPPAFSCSNVRDVQDNSSVLYNLLFETDYNSNLIMLKDVKEFGFDRCCYKNFSRKSEDAVTYSNHCLPVSLPTTVVPPEHKFITIYCLKNSNRVGNITVKFYEAVDMFNFVPVKSNVEERIKKLSKDLNSIERKASEIRDQLNVLTLGLDAVSHMNFIRTMPRSYKYLREELSAFGMKGYTKVGDNTFPNIVPALTGHSVSELDPICWNSSRKEPFDKCPFIWKNFSAAGYRTAYAEDAPWMGIFDYLKAGFLEQPTDYYLRPLTYEMAELIGHSKDLHAKLCYGPRLGFSVLLDNIRKLAFTMGKEKRYFQFTWATSLFHDHLNYPRHGDEGLLATLQWLKEEGYLENTVLILMSDHGIRYGPIRKTFQGKIEERMPFLYYSFPKWFSEKYRSAVSNMKLNRKRLTSPFDFYETMKDILYLNGITDERLKERHRDLNDFVDSNATPRGISLFLPIPLSRDCQAAGIEQHWCVCHNMETVPVKHELVQEAASAVVAELNTMFLQFPQCSTLELKEVLNAQALVQPKISSTRVKKFSNSKPVRYSVTLSTAPRNAVFEATMLVNHKEPRQWTLSGDISRINLYGTQSHCVTDYNMKKYCFCK